MRLNILGLFLWCAVGVATADSAPSAQPKWFVEFYHSVRQIVVEHYPQATTHLLNNKIHFEYKTRVFIVHKQRKIGEWRDPVEERGPDKGGLLGDIELREGKYNGQAGVPQTFDKHYFQVTVLAPYSERCNCYLYVHLLCPQDVDPEFFKRLTNEIASLDRRLSSGTDYNVPMR